MPEIIVPISLLSDAAKDFSKAQKDTAAIRVKLNKKMKNLEKTWNDLSKQQIFRYYQELDQQLIACNEIMSILALQMQAIAERYAAINK